MLWISVDQSPRNDNAKFLFWTRYYTAIINYTAVC